MPKELIHSRHVEDAGQVFAHVGWHPNGHVELATVNAAEDAARVTPDAVTNGWFVQLDRAGINRLIKALRKARDQAFGRDE